MRSLNDHRTGINHRITKKTISDTRIKKLMRKKWEKKNGTQKLN